MINVNVRSNTQKQTVIVELTSTPAQAFEEAGIDNSGTHVNIDGRVLNQGEINSTFEELGVEDGATVRLNSIVKMDGARQ